MQRLLPAIALFLAALFAGCATQQHQLRVVHTTDVHGHFTDGLTGVASFVDAARAQPTEVLLLDSGDMWSGTLMSDRTEGALGIAAYNAMGYAAAALGNHEFDYGPVGPDRTGGDDPFEALKARLAEARFPILSANLIDKATGQPPDWPNLRASTLIEVGGMKVGIVGATTVETPDITFPHVGNALAFTDATEAVTREATALREQGADTVILIAHIGAVCAPPDPAKAAEDAEPDGLSGCDRESELFQLVQGLPDGLIDMALGGHTHRPVSRRVGDVLVAHTGANATHVVDATISSAGGDISVSGGDPVPVDGAEATSGPTRAALDAVLAPALAAQTARREERLGAQIVQTMTRAFDMSSQVGSFLCDVLLELHTDREICVLNSGGIRAELPAGEVTYGQLYDALPFGNYAANLDIPGSVLLDLLNLGTSGDHGVIQVGGLTVSYDPNIVKCATDDSPARRLVSALGPDGAPIDPDRTYRIVTNSFLAAGGDGWREVMESLNPGSVQVLDHQLQLREQIAAWMRDKRPILNSPDRPVMPKPRLSKHSPSSAPAAEETPAPSGGRCGP